MAEILLEPKSLPLNSLSLIKTWLSPQHAPSLVLEVCGLDLDGLPVFLGDQSPVVDGCGSAASGGVLPEAPV